MVGLESARRLRYEWHLDRGVSDSDAGAFGAAGDWDRFGWSCLFAPAAGASRVVALEKAPAVLVARPGGRGSD
jgi:hypothetical protein